MDLYGLLISSFAVKKIDQFVRKAPTAYVRGLSQILKKTSWTELKSKRMSKRSQQLTFRFQTTPNVQPCVSTPVIEAPVSIDPCMTGPFNIAARVVRHRITAISINFSFLKSPTGGQSSPTTIILVCCREKVRREKGSIRSIMTRVTSLWSVTGPFSTDWLFRRLLPVLVKEISGLTLFLAVSC